MQFSSYHHNLDKDFQFLNSVNIIKNNLDQFISSSLKCKEQHIFDCKNCSHFMSIFNERFQDLESHKWKWNCEMCGHQNVLEEMQQLGYKQIKMSLQKNETVFCPLNLQEDYQMMSIQTNLEQLKKQTYIYVLDQSNSTLTTYSPVGFAENFGQQIKTQAELNVIKNNENHDLIKKLKQNYGFTEQEINTYYQQIIYQHYTQKQSLLEIAVNLGKLNAKQVQDVYTEAVKQQQEGQDGNAYFQQNIKNVESYQLPLQVNRWGIIVELVYEHLKYLQYKYGNQCNAFFIIFSDNITIVPPNKNYDWDLTNNICNLIEIYPQLGVQVFLGDFNSININTQALDLVDNLSLILDVLFVDKAYNGENWNCDDIRYILLELQPEGETALGPALFSSLKFSKVLNSFSTQIILITDGLANRGIGSLEEIENLRRKVQQNQKQYLNNLFEEEKKSKQFYQNLGKMARSYNCTINIISFNDEISDLYILNQATNQNGGTIGSIEIDINQNSKQFTQVSFAKILHKLKSIEGKKKVKISGCSVKLMVQKPFYIKSIQNNQEQQSQTLEYVKGSLADNDIDVLFISKDSNQIHGQHYLISCKIEFETNNGIQVQLYHVINKQIKETIEDFYSINYELLVIVLCKLLELDNEHPFIENFFQFYENLSNDTENQDENLVKQIQQLIEKTDLNQIQINHNNKALPSDEVTLGTNYTLRNTMNSLMQEDAEY